MAALPPESVNEGPLSERTGSEKVAVSAAPMPMAAALAAGTVRVTAGGVLSAAAGGGGGLAGSSAGQAARKAATSTEERIRRMGIRPVSLVQPRGARKGRPRAGNGGFKTTTYLGSSRA